MDVFVFSPPFYCSHGSDIPCTISLRKAEEIYCRSLITTTEGGERVREIERLNGKERRRKTLSNRNIGQSNLFLLHTWKSSFRLVVMCSKTIWEKCKCAHFDLVSLTAAASERLAPDQTQDMALFRNSYLFTYLLQLNCCFAGDFPSEFKYIWLSRWMNAIETKEQSNLFYV